MVAVPGPSPRKGFPEEEEEETLSSDILAVMFKHLQATMTILDSRIRLRLLGTELSQTWHRDK